jgi:CelD/BcsL family acetyltransferase involved in cellulose biosynthesis
LVAFARAEGRLIGVLPMVTGPGRNDPTRFAGAALGDRFGPLLAADVPEGLGGALFDRIVGASRRTPVELVRVEAAGGWWAGAGAHRSIVAAPAGVWPVAVFGEDGWDGYLASRSRNMRSQIRRRLRALEGAQEVSLWSPASPGEVDAGMSELFRLHAARWEERPEHSSFDRPEAHEFHRGFAHAAAELGWLRLYLLQVEGESVAAWYGWRLGDSVSYFQAGYDPEWASKSVGSVLFAKAARAAADEGAECFDMLLGDEAFKLRYATRVDEAEHVVVAGRWSRARVRASARARLRPMWRSLPQGVRTRLRGG